MRSPLPPCPKGPYVVLRGDDGQVWITDAKGNSVLDEPGGAERLVECANALAKVWYPQAHVSALEERCERLEGYRKAAVARTQELEQVQ